MKSAWRLKGILTVELSLLMPILFLTLLMPIRIGLMLYQETSISVCEQWNDSFEPVTVFYGKELVREVVQEDD